MRRGRKATGLREAKAAGLLKGDAVRLLVPGALAVCATAPAIKVRLSVSQETGPCMLSDGASPSTGDHSPGRRRLDPSRIRVGIGITLANGIVHPSDGGIFSPKASEPQGAPRFQACPIVGGQGAEVDRSHSPGYTQFLPGAHDVSCAPTSTSPASYARWRGTIGSNDRASSSGSRRETVCGCGPYW